MFRRQFESVTRRPGMDPATFATELEILAVRGFGDMGKRARDWMIRDRCIAAQRSFGLRRHLDGVPLEQKESGSDTGLDQDPLGRSGDSREPRRLCPDSQEPMERPVVDSRVPVPVVGLNGRWGMESQLAPLEVISSLVTRLLRTAQEGRPANAKVPPEEGTGSSSAVPCQW